MPAIWHALIENPDLDADHWERRLYLVRRHAEKLAEARGVGMYVASCSSRTGMKEGAYCVEKAINPALLFVGSGTTNENRPLASAV